MKMLEIMMAIFQGQIKNKMLKTQLLLKNKEKIKN